MFKQVSFILKIYDCFVIGIITLKYILNFENDAWWAIILKIFGWILVFPLMIITPMAGVFRYSVLPVIFLYLLNLFLIYYIVFTLLFS